MKKYIFIPVSLFLIAFVFMTSSCDKIEEFLPQDETAQGLREALKISTDTTVNKAGATNGFYGNAAIKILFPPEAQEVLDFADNNPFLGAALNSLTENFVQRMNQAAEQAAPLAKDIFKETITNITITDALGILNGGNDAATIFLENNARQPLFDAFHPIVEDKISAVGADDIWSNVTGTYNTISGQQVNTDINAYVTDKALDGLFHLIAEEEEKIRNDPLHRVTDLLERVFGS
ncbi:MAG: DUF4197 domain-containing protein [Chitinophagales bacterium]